VQHAHDAAQALVHRLCRQIVGLRLAGFGGFSSCVVSRRFGIAERSGGGDSGCSVSALCGYFFKQGFKVICCVGHVSASQYLMSAFFLQRRRTLSVPSRIRHCGRLSDDYQRRFSCVQLKHHNPCLFRQQSPTGESVV
jgi:hypothetical protein